MAAEQGVEVDGAAIPAFRDITSKQAAPQLNFVVRRQGICIIRVVVGALRGAMAVAVPGTLL